MKKSLVILLFFNLLFAITQCFGYSTILTENSFSSIRELILQDQHPHHLLVAVDDDDTLTMVPCVDGASNCQYLGGPAWFTWQAGLPANNPDRIYTTFSQLLAIDNLLFTMNHMVLDDSSIPAALQAIQQVGAHMIVASARGFSMENATETQFSQDNILNLIEATALKTKNNHISIHGTYYPREWNNTPTRQIAYLHGTLYLAGQNKGEMIKQFLQKTDKTSQIQEIIFVDDTYQNVVDVANTFKNDPNVDVISIHYTKLAAHKAAFLTGNNAKKLQAIANQRWQGILVSMRKNLPATEF